MHPELKKPFPRLPLSESKPTAVAYFSVATLEAPQVGKNDHGAAPFGCVIDPSATTMIQTGLINSPVPDAYGYLGIGEIGDYTVLFR